MKAQRKVVTAPEIRTRKTQRLLFSKFGYGH